MPLASCIVSCIMIFIFLFYLYRQLLPSPRPGFSMRCEVKVYALGALYGRAAVLHYAPAIAGHIHNRPERIVLRISGYSAGTGKQQPGEEYNAHRYHPRMRYAIDRNQAGGWFPRLFAAGRVSLIAFPFVRPCIIIPVPEIQL